MKRNLFLLCLCLVFMAALLLTVGRQLLAADKKAQADMTKRAWLRNRIITLLVECQEMDYIKREMIGADVISSWISSKNESEEVQEFAYYAMRLSDLIASIQGFDDSESELWTNDPAFVRFDEKLRNMQLVKEQVVSRQLLTGAFRKMIVQATQENAENRTNTDEKQSTLFVSAEKQFATEEWPHESEEWWQEFNQWRHQEGTKFQVNQILSSLKDVSFEGLLDEALACLPSKIVPFGPHGDRFRLLTSDRFDP